MHGDAGEPQTVDYTDDLRLSDLQGVPDETITVRFSTTRAQVTTNADGTFGLQLHERMDRPPSFHSACGSGPAHEKKLAETLGIAIISGQEQYAFRHYMKTLTPDELMACLRTTAAFHANTMTEATLPKLTPREIQPGEIPPEGAYAHWQALQAKQPPPRLQRFPAGYVEEVIRMAEAERAARMAASPEDTRCGFLRWQEQETARHAKAALPAAHKVG